MMGELSASISVEALAFALNVSCSEDWKQSEDREPQGQECQRSKAPNPVSRGNLILISIKSDLQQLGQCDAR
jgi:hypothetical protein